MLLPSGESGVFSGPCSPEASAGDCGGYFVNTEGKEKADFSLYFCSGKFALSLMGGLGIGLIRM